MVMVLQTTIVKSNTNFLTGRYFLPDVLYLLLSFCQYVPQDSLSALLCIIANIYEEEKVPHHLTHISNTCIIANSLILMPTCPLVYIHTLMDIVLSMAKLIKYVMYLLLTLCLLFMLQMILSQCAC